MNERGKAVIVCSTLVICACTSYCTYVIRRTCIKMYSCMVLNSHMNVLTSITICGWLKYRVGDNEVERAASRVQPCMQP